MDSNEKEPLVNTREKSKTSFTYNVLLMLSSVVMYYLGLGTYFYVVNEWIQHYEQSRVFTDGNFSSSSVCGNINQSDPNHVLYEQVESETAKWQMFASLAWNIPAAIATAILPAYSDCFGRKFILIVGCAGTLVKLSVSTFTVYFNLHPLYIVIAAIVEGFTGSFYSVMSGCWSFMADITEVGRRRTLGLTLVDGVSMICMTLSGLGSGYFVKYTGYFIPIATSCGMCACSFVMFLFIVPETYPKHMRSKARSLCAVLKRTFNFYISDTFKKKRFAYLLLLVAYVLENLTSGPRASLELLYQLGRPFCWSLEKIGIFSALRHVAQGFTGIFIIKPLQFCLSDLNIAILSMIFGSGSFVLEGLARTDLMLYMVPVLASLAFLCESMIKSLMSTMTPPDQQGSLFSGIVMTQVISITVANFMFNTIYANTVSFMSGFIFQLQAGICLITITVLMIFSMTKRQVLHVEMEKAINIIPDG